MDDQKIGSHALENCVLGMFVTFVVMMFVAFELLRVAVGSVLVFCLVGWLLKRGAQEAFVRYEVRRLRRPDVQLALFQEAREELRRQGLLSLEKVQDELRDDDSGGDRAAGWAKDRIS